jgi:hypothetical protein
MKRGRIILLIVVATALGWAAYAWTHRKWSYELPPGPVIAYKIDGDYTIEDPNARKMRRWPILQERPTDEFTSKKIRDVLNDGSNYRQGGGSKCFNPGMGFRLGSPDRAVEVLICLHCKHVYFYEVGADESVGGAKGISDEGMKAFGSLYKSLFPNSPPESTTRVATTKTILSP